MSDNTPIYRRFHPLIADAYNAVHQWIESQVKDANGYKEIPYSDLKQKLQKTDWKHIAFQYYTFFPTHYFKAAHTLDNIIGDEQLTTWLRHRQKVCVLDVGCGAGAGSAAFLEAVIRLKQQEKLTNDVNILFIGIDPSHRAIGLYRKMMENLKSSSANLVNLYFESVIEGFPDATIKISQILQQELILSKLPCMTNVLAMQLNVISPFSQTYRNCQANINELRSLGIDIEGSIAEDSARLGTAEAQAYKQLVEVVPIDVMHILTIGTKNMEKYVQIGTDSEVTLNERIKEMACTLSQIIGNRHNVHQGRADWYRVHYRNPLNSYWREQRNSICYYSDFYADYQTIWSADLAEDEDWNSVISADNLKLAWARARNNLLREAFCDETEIRLFEINLDARLSGLREQLCAYANDVALNDDRISYRVPKNITNTRPRALSRIEEEILSVAVIQRLGDKASQLRGSSYAYRISVRYGNRDTEYLYEYWFKAYCYYIKKARDSANKHLEGAILRVDIESFYTKIVQSQLCDELSRELTESERIRWLIRLLLSQDIDEHEVGHGITQGGIGSGFYANIYLTPIDAIFGTGNEWGVEFHRYVDDMIFVIPYPDDMDKIENVLRDELQKLGLRLNERKTERIDKVSVFLQQSKEDECLEILSERYDCIVNPLWMLNSEHRTIFVSSSNNNERWWHNIECYHNCLRAIKIYKSETELSRKIYGYLFNKKRRERDLANQKKVFGQGEELKFTRLTNINSLDAAHIWSNCFIKANSTWNQNRNELRKDLVALFHYSWQELQNLDNNNAGESRKLERYIRFALTRLSVLGLEDIIIALLEILYKAFWIIRDPSNVLENLARQGYASEIRSLLTHYQNLNQPVEYLKAITIRAMRFLPNIDDQDWELIVGFSTSSDNSVSVAEKLMATETWLYLGHKYNDFKQNRHIEAVKNALRSKPSPPSRLEKNYLLILGQFEPSAVQEFSVNPNDPMLVGARDLALQGSPSEIFDLPEPKILRANYYSGQSPTDSEQGSP